LDLGLKLAPAASLPDGEKQGVVVISIDPSGRAADLGFETGDVILDVSGSSVRAPDEVRNALSEAQGAGRHAALIRIKSGENIRFIAVPVGAA